MTKILITGSNGFIGRALVEKFHRNTPHDIFAINRSDCDLTNLNALESLSQKLGPQDIVIHTAAKANSVEFKNAGDVLTNNILSTQNLIQTFPDAYHIFFSSVVVYRSPGTNPNSGHSTTDPHSIYGVSKIACEKLYSAAERIAGTKSTFLRCCAAVGPNPTHGILKAILGKIQDNPSEIELFGAKPGSKKPFIHIDDIYLTVKYYVDEYIQNELHSYLLGPMNLCPRDNLTVLEVAEILFKKHGVSPHITWRRDMVWKGDNRLIRCQDDRPRPWKKTVRQHPLYETSAEAVQNYDVEKF